jgi:hypothetical protein
LILSEVVKGEIDDAEEHKEVAISRFLKTLNPVIFQWTIRFTVIFPCHF